ncbi:lipoyl(octanoyl) transferase LipB [Hyphomicrobium methylovorum]|uniref:lipoyl(octanoyl) transferase LipB n=1 Tax=Hyphomicrobium methylovorum TaxID=84 RepID=UPI001FE331AF|nr:lipoyl(octanoyl) transferase LipB [Hyphomicrobium methylovorum]
MTYGAAAIADISPVEWSIGEAPVDYPFALNFMKERAGQIRDGTARELVWLLEHPPLITGGTGAKDVDLLDPARFPVFRSGRGGKFTYHGPGQRVVYVMLDLKSRGFDVRGFVNALETWVVATLATFNVKGETRRDRVGVWVRRPAVSGSTEDKIAAIGLRVSRSVSSHGISINVDPEMSHYEAIVPCGIQGHGVTSLADLGLPVTQYDVDVALRATFRHVFGPVVSVEPIGGPPPEPRSERN